MSERIVHKGKHSTILAVDERGDGNANHLYYVKWKQGNTPCSTKLKFQKGTLKEAGVNGITHEDLTAILIDRLQGFQDGPFACRENACALTHLEEALMWLNKRTHDRLARGVEGTHTL